jgi:hypothetical protein
MLPTLTHLSDASPGPILLCMIGGPAPLIQG